MLVITTKILISVSYSLKSYLVQDWLVVFPTPAAEAKRIEAMATQKNIIPNESLSLKSLSSVPSSPKILPSVLSSGPLLNTENVLMLVDSTQRSDLSIDEALERLVLSDKGATQMFTLIGAIFQRAIEQGRTTDLDVEDWRSLLQQADESSRNGQPDIDALGLIRKILACLWSSKSEEIVEATKLLADGCRERELDSGLQQGALDEGSS